MAVTGRPKVELVVTEIERAELVRLTNRARVNRTLAFRAKLVLACADRATNSAVAGVHGRRDRPHPEATAAADQRFGRELALWEAARAALDRVCPKAGLMFGDHDRIMLLRRAARAAGIDRYRAKRISDYDFRHSRLTDLGQHSDNLAGVMYLAGHKQPATTARYLRPQKDAAAEG
jgi:integrase